MAVTERFYKFEVSYLAQDYSQQMKHRQRYLDMVYNDSGKTSAGGGNNVSLGGICKLDGILPWQNDRKTNLGGGGRETGRLEICEFLREKNRSAQNANSIVTSLKIL